MYARVGANEEQILSKFGKRVIFCAGLVRKSVEFAQNECRKM